MKTHTKPNCYVSAFMIMAIWIIIIGSISFSIYCDTLPVYLLSIFFIGTCQRYLDEIAHQAMHNNLFANAILNNYLDIFYAIPLFYTIAGTREKHYLHHTHLAQEQADKIYAYDHLGISAKLIDSAWYRCFILYIQPFLGIQSIIELKNIIVNSKRYFFNCYLYHLFLIAVLLYNQMGHVYLYYWLIPYFTVFCIFYYYSELFSHFGCRGAYLSRDTANWFCDFFIAPLGFCKYHSLHHKAPKLPWFRYKAIANQYQSNTQNLKQTFISMFYLRSE